MIADAISGKSLAEAITEKLGIGLEFVSEINLFFDPDKTIVYIWYSDFCDKDHDRFMFEQNDDFSELLCDALGVDATNTQKVSLTIPSQGVVFGDVVVKLTMIATERVSNLDWSKAFTRGASVVCNDSTVAREDNGVKTVDIED